MELKPQSNMPTDLECKIDSLETIRQIQRPNLQLSLN